MILIKQGNTTLYTVSNYTYTESEMGDSNITLKLSVPVNMQVVVVGQPEVDVLAPAFALDWYVEENGEKFYLTTNKPQGSKSTGSLDYIYDLIFDSERSALKKRMVKDLASLGSDTFVSQGLIFKLTNANITTFAQLIQNNLTDCFGTKWAIVINPAIISSVTATVLLEVSNTYIWDLLLKIYEFYGLRWKIQSINGVMTIRVGYDAVEISHIFEYGSQTGLTNITRQITDTKVINRLRGTGGTRNLPTNYFTNRYSGFDPDPNVLAGMFSFKNLMPKCFRDSVIAHNANNLLPLIDYVTLPNIPENGVIEDGLEPNEEIYPSIEGVSVAGLGRIDEIVAVESTNFDDPEYKSGHEFTGVKCIASTYNYRTGTDISTKVEYTDVFVISEARNIVCQLNLQYCDQYDNIVPPPYTYKIPDGTSIVTIGTVTEVSTKLELIDVATGLVVGSATKMFYDTANLTKELDTTKDIEYKNLPVGSYKFKLTNVANGNVGANNRTMKFSAVGVLTNIKNVTGIYKPTFDIWVKDIQFDLAATGTDGVAKYASTEDGIIAFKSGSLAGYEFKILKVSTESNVFACVPDTSKSLNGVPSKYRITLIKNDTEYQAGSQMLPNVAVHAVPADQFAILGINMPFSYVTLAEERLQAYLSEQLIIASKLYPTYNVGLLDIFLQENPDITDDIRSGNKFRIRDKRLTDGDMSLYINAVTIEHSGLLPKYNVTVTDKATVNGSTVQRISSQIDAISAGQYAGQQSLEMSIANLDKRYLRKNIEDVAYEEIDLKGGVKASTIKTEDFEQGQLSGSGMGVFKDQTGATILEVDKLTVRDTAVFNEVVINQIKFQGGIVVYSAANMEVIKVEADTVFFDLKRGTVQNQFAVNDIIRCQRWVEGVQVKYYMSVVVEVGVDYIKLSTTTTDGVLNPSESDIIVQFGNTTDVLRQAVIEVDVLNGGKQTFYQGLNSFVTTNKNTIDIGRVQDTDNVWKTMMRVYGDAYIGARDLSSYMKFNSTTQQLEIAASLKFIAPDGSLKSVSDTFTGFESEKQNAVVNGKTIIVGGYLNTELIRTDMLIANRILTAETGERIALNINNDNALKIYDASNVMRVKLGHKDGVPAFIFYDAAGAETFNLSSLGIGGSLTATRNIILNNGDFARTIDLDADGNIALHGGVHSVGNMKVDGLMDIGKYLDFHETENDGIDFSARLEARDNGIYFQSSNTSQLPAIQGYVNGFPDVQLINPFGGNVIIGGSVNTGQRLQVAGNIKADGLLIKDENNLSDVLIKNSYGTLTANGYQIGARIYKIDELLSGTFSSEDISNSVNAYVGKNLLQRVTAIETTGSQPQFNGTGFVKVNGSVVSYDNSSYLSYRTFGSAADYNADVNATDDTIVKRSGSGLAMIIGGYLKTTLANVNAVAPVNFFTEAGDGVLRLTSLANTRAFLGLGSSAYTNTNDHILNQNSSAQVASMWINGIGNFGQYIAIDGRGVTSTSKNFTSLSSDNNATTLLASNLYLDASSLKISVTHGSMSGAAIKMAGNAQQNQGGIEFYTRNPTSVTSGDLYSEVSTLLLSANKTATFASTVSATQFRANYVGETFVCNQSNGYAYSMRISNSGGSLYVGIENTEGSYFGAAAYNSVIYSPNNNITIKTPNALYTGTLSSVGTIYTYAGEGIRMIGSDAYLSGFNAAGTIRNGYLQFTGNSIYISAENGSGDIALINKNAVIIRNDVGGEARIQLTGSHGSAKQYSIKNSIYGISNTGFSIRNDSNGTTPFYIDGSDNSVLNGSLYSTGKITTNDLFLTTNSTVGNSILINASGANYGAIQTISSNSWGLGTGGGGVDRNINNTALTWDINKNITTGGNINLSSNTNIRTIWGGVNGGCIQILSDPSTVNRWVRMGVCGSTGDFYAGLSITNDGNSVFSGTVGATQFNGSGAGLTGIASSLTVGTLMNTGGGGICSSALGTGYNYAVCMREVSGYGGYTGGEAAPRLGFHWGGIVASSISIGTNGSFYFNNNPGTGREHIYCSNVNANIFYGDGSGLTGTASNLRTDGAYKLFSPTNPQYYITHIWDGLGWNLSASNNNGDEQAYIHKVHINGNSDTVDGVHIWRGSRASYDALSKDGNTMYIIL